MTAENQAQGAPKRASWADLKKQHRNTRQSTRVTLRGDLLDEVERLEADMRREAEIDKWQNRDPVALQIAKAIQVLEEQARESEVEFTFEALGRGEYAKLIAAHRPTAAQKELYGEYLEWNADTFPPALLAASCAEPAELAGNLAEWTEIHTTWSNGQVTRIWNTCVLANAGVADTPKSLEASEALRERGSGRN